MCNGNGKICKICGLPESIHKGMKHVVEGEGGVTLISIDTPEYRHKDWGFNPAPK